MGEISWIAYADVLPDSEPEAGKRATKRMEEDQVLGESLTADGFDDEEAPFYVEAVYEEGTVYLEKVKDWRFNHDEYGTMVVTYMDESTEKFKLGQITALWKEKDLEVNAISE